MVRTETDSRDANDSAAERRPIAVKPIANWRNDVKSSTQDKTEGKLHEVKGSIKEIAGKVTKNRKLVRKGKAEKRAGKAQEKVGQAKKVLGK